MRGIKAYYRCIGAGIAAITLLSGCPKKTHETPLARDELVIEQLVSRRGAMNPVEADVKFMFPPGAFMTSSLEGHAAYRLNSGEPQLRLTAIGPLGAVSLDLLVDKGDFLVRLPGYDDPLGQQDLVAIYGDSALIRTPTVLAKMPGLFFGGLPDKLDSSWKFEDDPFGRWLSAPDGRARYLVKGNPATITKAVIHEKDIGTLAIVLSEFEDTGTGPIPTRIDTKFEGRVLFSFRVRNYTFGGALPESVFEMGVERGENGS